MGTAPCVITLQANTLARPIFDQTTQPQQFLDVPPTYWAEPYITTSVTLRLLPPEAAPHLPALVKDLEASARVQHPHLVRVLGLVTLSGRRCVVTQFVKGESLAGSLPAGQRLPLSQAQAIARGLAQMLAAVHAQGLAHGGVQPSNILSVAGVLKVTDLGLGRLRLALAPATPYRAAPETRNRLHPPRPPTATPLPPPGCDPTRRPRG